MLEHDIPHSTFSNAVLDCLPEEGDKFYDTIQDKDRVERADFRDLDVCSGEKNSWNFMHLLFRAEYKPRGYYLEHFWQADLGCIGQAIIGVKVPNSNHVACIQHGRVHQ